MSLGIFILKSKCTHVKGRNFFFKHYCLNYPLKNYVLIHFNKTLKLNM